MRVGIIANTFEKSIGSAAGGHVHFLEIAKRWGDLELVVFAPRLAEDVIRAELPRAAFVALPNLDKFVSNRQVRYLARTLMSLGRAKALRSCDVILATSHFLPDVVPALFARGSRCAVCIQHVLDPPSVRAGRFLPNLISSIMQSLALRLIASRSQAILVNDEAVADKIGVDRKKTKVTIMSNGIEHVTGGLRTTEGGVGGGPLKGTAGAEVLYLGRLVPTKGLDDLLRAWVDVSHSVPDAKLTIAGTGESQYVETLRLQALQSGIAPSVKFAGQVSDEEKRRLLGNADIFAFPSKEEGWGIVLAEAMAYGLPCVTYDLPAYRQPFGYGRASAPIGDAKTFATRIVELLTDDSRRTILSSEARILSEGFSWAAAAAIERRTLEQLARRAS